MNFIVQGYMFLLSAHDNKLLLLEFEYFNPNAAIHVAPITTRTHLEQNTAHIGRRKGGVGRVLEDIQAEKQKQIRELAEEVKEEKRESDASKLNLGEAYVIQTRIRVGDA